MFCLCFLACCIVFIISGVGLKDHAGPAFAGVILCTAGMILLMSYYPQEYCKTHNAVFLNKDDLVSANLAEYSTTNGQFILKIKGGKK